MPDPIDEVNSQQNDLPQEQTPSPQTNFNDTPINTQSYGADPTSGTNVTPNPEPVSNTPFVPDEAPKKSHKKLIISVVAAFIALIGLGSGVAYALYMNNPDKILLDATQNLMKANTVITKGTFVADSKQNKISIKVEFSSQNDNAKQAGSLDAKVAVNYMDMKLNLDGEGMMAESGDLYFKVNNSPKVLDTVLKSELGNTYASQPTLAPVVEKLKTLFKKIDGQWIKLEAKDIDLFLGGDYSKQETCTKKALATFNKSDEQQKQVIDTYSENPFITIESAGKSAAINNQDSAAYDISYDVRTSNTFGNELEKTDVIKAINKCTDTKSEPTNLSNDQAAQQQKQANSIKTTLWISKQGHELQKVDIENKDKKPGNVQFSMTLDTKTKPNLKDPNKFLTLKDILTEVKAIEAEVNTLTGGIYQRAETTKARTNAAAIQKRAEVYAADHDGVYPTLDQLKADQGAAKLTPELLAIVSSDAPDAAHQDRIQYLSCNNGVAYSVFYWDVLANSISEDMGIGFDC